MRRRAIIRDVLPLPEGPQMASFSPEVMVSETEDRTGGDSGLVWGGELVSYSLEGKWGKWKGGKAHE